MLFCTTVPHFFSRSGNMCLETLQSLPTQYHKIKQPIKHVASPGHAEVWRPICVQAFETARTNIVDMKGEPKNEPVRKSVVKPVLKSFRPTPFGFPNDLSHHLGPFSPSRVSESQSRRCSRTPAWRRSPWPRRCSSSASTSRAPCAPEARGGAQLVRGDSFGFSAGCDLVTGGGGIGGMGGGSGRDRDMILLAGTALTWDVLECSCCRG